MKNILIAFLFFPSLSFTQGNLQFNQVINIKNGTTYTVPAGKAFKIESINQNSPFITRTYSGTCMINCPGCGASSGVTCNYNTLVYFKIGTSISFEKGGQYYVNSGGACSVCPPTINELVSIPSTFVFPIWVPAGEEIRVYAANIFISGIEFNIVQ